MSYASVASRNMPPNQPTPDPALLNTVPGTASTVADDSAKVNVVSSDFRDNPATTTSTFVPPNQPLFEDPAPQKSSDGTKYHAHRHHHTHKPPTKWFSVIQEVVLRPTVAGGLIGVVNLGIIGYTGYAFYTEAQIRRNPRVLSASIAGSVALLGLEGYVVEELRRNEGGDDAAIVAQYFRENPSKLQGLFGALNVGVVGLTSFIMYKNWHELDARTVTAVAGGIATLWAGEGYLLANC